MESLKKEKLKDLFYEVTDNDPIEKEIDEHDYSVGYYGGLIETFELSEEQAKLIKKFGEDEVKKFFKKMNQNITDVFINLEKKRIRITYTMDEIADRMFDD